MKKGEKIIELYRVNIISFIEDNPSSIFPAWYKLEVLGSDKESFQYKDLPVIEKGWMLYENLFCNLGKGLKNLIKTENDFSKKDNEPKIKKEEALFAKYIPSFEECIEFMGADFIPLEKFIIMYVDMIDVELDEDIIWPYQWPFNI